MGSLFTGKAFEPVIIAVEPFGGSLRDHRAQLPLVYWDDAAVTRGEGVFETLLVRGRQVCNLARHAARFVDSASLLDLPIPNIEYWERATRMAIDKWLLACDGADPTMLEAKCTWTYTRGRASTGIPSAWVTLTPIDATVLAQREHGVKVLTTPRGYSIDYQADSTSEATAPWLVVGAKTLAYAANMAALRYARAHDFDDVIFTDPTGTIVYEGATSTVVSVRGNKIRTPQPGGDILPGTTQAALFDVATAHGWRVKEKQLLVNDLLKADSVWLVSSVRVAARVRRINDTKLPKPDNEAEILALLEEAVTGEK